MNLRTGWILFIAIQLLPASIAAIDSRGLGRTLVISMSRSLPAQAAFADLTLDLQLHRNKANPIATHNNLLAGVSFQNKSNASEYTELKGLRVAAANNVKPQIVAALSPQEQLLQEYDAQLSWQNPTVAERAQELLEQELGAAAYNQLLASTAVAKAPAVDEPNPGWIPASIESPRLRPLSLSGQIEMAGGLAFTGADHIIAITRVDAGNTQERGQVWVRDAHFDIAVSSLKGYLVAELLNARGEILGRGELDLYDVPTPPANEIKIKNLKLTLKPVLSGTTIQVVSSESFDKYKIPVPGVGLEVIGAEAEFEKQDDTTFVGAHFAEGSSFLVRATAKNFWGTSAIGLWNVKSEVQLFSEARVRALLNLVLSEEESRVAENYAIIWGRVTEGGQPTGGAEVELAGDGLARSIYFNEAFIPDRRLTATTHNGLFVFVMVTPGIQSLRAKLPRGYLPAQVVSADRRTVSFAELDFGSYRTAGVRVFDPFNESKQIYSTVSILGTEAELDVQGEDQIQYVSGMGQMMLDVDPGTEYEMSRAFVSRQTNQINVPVISRDWLTALIARKKVNLDSNAGIFVGFVVDEDFEVVLDIDAKIDSSQLVFFDGAGNVIYGNKGVAGGGVVIFNVPTGYRTISMVGKNKNKIFTHAFVAEDRFVTVLHTRIGK